MPSVFAHAFTTTALRSGLIGAGAVLSGAGTLIGSETNGLAIDFTDMSAIVRDTTTPANAFSGNPNDLLTYSAPSIKMIHGSDGLLKYAQHNRFRHTKRESAWASETNISASVSGEEITWTEDTTAGVNHEFTIDPVAGIINTIGQPVYISLMAKANGRSYLRILATGVGGSGDNNFAVSLVDGTHNASSGLTVTDVSATEGAGWWKIEWRGEHDFTTSAMVRILMTTTFNPGATTYNGDGVSGIVVKRPQYCYAPVDTTYIHNSGAALKFALPLDHEPLTPFTPKGILVESQRTNLLLQSQTFDNASWAKATFTVTADNIVSPDGTMNAELFTQGGGGTAQKVYQSVAATAVAHTLSIYVKQGTNAHFRLGLSTSTSWGADDSAWFNISTGVVGTRGLNITYSAIEDCGNGWYRCSITRTLTAASWTAIFSTVTSDGVASSGEASTFYAWQAQLEAGAFPTSPIVTGTAQVTRAADNINLATTAFPYSTSTSTLYSSQTYKDNYSGFGVGCSLLATTANTITHQHRLTTELRLSVFSGGVAQADLRHNVGTGGSHKIASAVAANDAATSANGGVVLTDATVTMPAVNATNLNFGAEQNFNHLDDHLKQVMYLPRRMANADLVTLSTP